VVAVVLALRAGFALDSELLRALVHRKKPVTMPAR